MSVNLGPVSKVSGTYLHFSLVIRATYRRLKVINAFPISDGVQLAASAGFTCNHQADRFL